MKSKLLATTSAVAFMALAPVPAQASHIVGIIYGAYDAQCGSNIDCTFGHPGYAVTGNGGTQYDTPSLFIVNLASNTHSFDNLSFTLTGYQDRNNGGVATFMLPGNVSIAPGTVYDLTWGGSTMNFSQTGGQGNLFQYDYDDEFGAVNTCVPNPINTGFCADVGNFDVHIAGTLNGNAISSSFSPDNTQDGGNQQGSFVPWIGLDQAGKSEDACCDTHQTSQPGILAFIFTGTTGNQKVPEPVSLAILGGGLGALSMLRRRRKQS
jgi:hypothetical protein